MIILVPAYGRSYMTLDEAIADWIAGKDFKIFKGPYCSIRDSELIRGMSHSIVITAGNRLELSKVLTEGESNVQ